MHVLPNQPGNRSIAIRFSEEEAKVLLATSEWLVEHLNEESDEFIASLPPRMRLARAQIIDTMSNLWIILSDTSDIHLAEGTDLSEEE